jgi:mono/diheme cytochrome c family protein
VTARLLRLARPLAAALAGLALAGCPRLDPMQRQAKYKAYQASDFFDDGLTMRAPPEGTVPYRSLLDPAVETGLGADGKPLAVSPVPFDPALLARGRAKFEVSCAVCHGLLGDGDSQVALNMSLRRPPSLHLYRDRPDGYIYQVVTSGFGLMPSYAHSLSVHDRWAVVAYVRALQLSQHAPVDQLPQDVRERLEKEKTP